MASINKQTPDTSTPATAQQCKHLQQGIGKFLYYGRAVDTTILHTTNNLSSQQSKATTNTIKDYNCMLDYLATHPQATIRYHASPMQLHVHSDASYLTAPEARSWAGRHFWLSNEHHHQSIPYNGPIHSLVKIQKNVLTSAAEAEVGALYLNVKEAVPSHVALQELGHPQQQTPITIDNSTAMSIANNECKQIKTKTTSKRGIMRCCPKLSITPM